MPNPGDLVYKIGSILTDGDKCRVEVLIGTVPEQGATQFRARQIRLSLAANGPNAEAPANAAALAVFRAAIATALVNENEPIEAIAGGTLIEDP